MQFKNEFKNEKDEFAGLARAFNTAVVSSLASEKNDVSSELFGLSDSPAFKTILAAINALSREQGVAEHEAATQVIQTFRKMDKLWSEQLLHEGYARIKNAN